jgi:hypothetical protein
MATGVSACSGRILDLMRRIVVVIALLTALGLAVAGLAQASGSGREPTAASLKRRQAKAFIAAVNLRAADLPGFKVSKDHDHETTTEKGVEQELMRCVGGTAFSNGLAEGESPSFDRETLGMDETANSIVYVARSSSVAAKELVALRSDSVRACLAHYLEILFKEQKLNGATLSSVSVAALTPTAPGTTGSFGWRTTITFTVHEIAIPANIDILGFVNGPAEVMLLTAGVPEPFPATAEHRLLSLLIHRAKTHRP